MPVLQGDTTRNRHPAASQLILKETDNLNPDSAQDLNLETFEDNYVGITSDSDDTPFMDFKLSVSYQLRFLDRPLHCIFRDNVTFNFAFTGRFAQYIGYRGSSPVVGKRFNPFLYFCWQPDSFPRNRFRLSFAHESNGQSVTDSAAFYATVRSLVPTKRDPDTHRQALDHISRGWDYIGLSWSGQWLEKHNLLTEISLREYLKYGLMQDTAEEYRDWERKWYGKRLHRNQVSGLATAVEYFFKRPRRFRFLKVFENVKFSYYTGLHQPLRNHSFSTQLGLRLAKLRLALTYFDGYEGDIAQFGKRNRSFGFSIILNSFRAPLALTGGSR